MNYKKTEAAKTLKALQDEILVTTQLFFNEKDVEKRKYLQSCLKYLNGEADKISVIRNNEIYTEGLEGFLIDGRPVYKKDIIAVQSKFDLDDEDAGRYALMLRDMGDFSLFDRRGEIVYEEF